jgi:hypothetical protein
VIVSLAASALAAPVDSEVFAPRPVAGRPVLELRAGVARSPHPYVCAEGQPLGWLSLEACGTGSGFLHQGDETDVAHFRSRARVLGVERGRVEADLLGGLGFAEVQTGRDEHGFRFGEARSDDQNEGAGPEASLGGKARVWVFPAAYLSFDATFGVAHVQSAPVVIGQAGPWVPFGTVTAGLGF